MSGEGSREVGRGRHEEKGRSMELHRRRGRERRRLWSRGKNVIRCKKEIL